MKWEQGRLGTGYRKMTLFMNELWDCHLIHCKQEALLHKHTDPVPGRKHFRLNVVLWPAAVGGKFRCAGAVTVGPFTLFRPDIMPHEVTRVQRGNRVVLSIGWTIRR